MVNWNAPDIKKFKKEARLVQQEYCDVLGDRKWDVIECWKWSFLRKKVGFGMYGPPSSTPSSDNRYTGYTEQQLDAIENICDKLVEDLNFIERDIRFACIFVIMKVHNNRYTVPVFKAKSKNGNKRVFVDAGARTYCSWEDFLHFNTLQKCIYCYPTRGFYEEDGDDEVCVSFGTSPACDLVSRVISTSDTASKHLSLGVGLVSLIPFTGPVGVAVAVTGAALSFYGVTRSTYDLYDRATHGQSISFNDPEARGCWLSIIGSSLGFVQGRMESSIARATRAGEITNRARHITHFVIQTGKLTANGYGVVLGISAMIEKERRHEHVTPLEEFQFCASIVFFLNATIKAKTVSIIVRDVQRDMSGTHRLNRHRRPHENHNRNRRVREVISIEDSDDFYELIANENVSDD